MAAVLAPVSALAKDGGGYKVEMTRLVLVAPPPAHPPGTERDLAPGEILFSAPIGLEQAAAPQAATTVEFAGIVDTIPAQAPLMAALSAKGGDLASLPAGARIFCAKERENLRAQQAAAKTAPDQLAFRSRSCLVDTEADGRFDKAFLVGLKRAADRRLVDIAPVPYQTASNLPFPDSRLDVRYDGGGLLRATFDLDLYVHGRRFPIIYLPAGRDRKGSIDMGVIFSDKVPHYLDFGTAQIIVLAFDKKTRRARIRHTRNLETTAIFPWTYHGKVVVDF